MVGEAPPTAASPARRRALEQWAGLGGIAYVVLFIIGAILSFSGQPSTNGPQEIPQIGIALWIAVAGALLFLQPARRPA